MKTVKKYHVLKYMMAEQKFTAEDFAEMTGGDVAEITRKYKFHLDPEAWYKDFRIFLRTKYLTRCFTSPKTKEVKALVKQMVADKYMGLWVSLVTHPLYDRNVLQNYERAEHYGDRGQGHKLSYYVFKKYPHFTEDDVTNIQNKYLSKERQARWSQEIGIPEFFRGFVEMNIDIQEDLFEALYAGIVLVGNKISAGLGDILGQNFINDLFKDIDLERTMKDPKTRYKDVIEIMWWFDGTNFKEDIDEKPVGGKIMYTLNLPNTAVEGIQREKGKKVNRQFIRTTAARSKNSKDVKKEMYEQALEKLEKLGYNREELLQQRKNIAVSSEMETKLETENLSNVRIERYKQKTDDDKTLFIYQIVAKNEEGDDVILYTANVNMPTTKITQEEIYKVIEKDFLDDEKKYPENVRRLRRQVIRKITVQN